MSKVRKPLLKATNLNKISKEENADTVQDLLDNLNVTFDVNECELKRLPTDSAFITVSNRPFGAIEELLLLKLLSDKHPSYRFLKNKLLKELPVFRKNAESLENIEIDEASVNSHLLYKKPLGILPVGDISNFQTPDDSFTDSNWNAEKLEQLLDCNVPIYPIYIEGFKKKRFKFAGMMHPVFRTRQLVKSLLNKENTDIRIRIGNPIGKKELNEFSNTNQFGRFLRAKLYSLGTPLDIKPFYAQKSTEQKIAAPIDPSILEKEIDALRETNCIGSKQEFEVYIAKTKKIPNAIKEIGRLRESTFREVGEGTGQSLDIDEFDLYYLHLFIWDKEQKRIAGAYRLGAGDYIMQSYGRKGFYLRSLFKINKKLNGVLAKSVELGRSFVVSDYQQKRLPLFLLWSGISYFLRTNPEYKYMIGPVSISNEYSKVSRSLIYQFIRQYYYDDEMARYVKPKKSFKPDFQNLDEVGLLFSVGNNTKRLDKILEDIEPQRFKMPILLKKYFSQNAQIIGFNIDPNFNDALDGFMVCKVDELPDEAIEKYS